jgi:hypothetical protein
LHGTGTAAGEVDGLSGYTRAATHDHGSGTGGIDVDTTGRGVDASRAAGHERLVCLLIQHIDTANSLLRASDRAGRNRRALDVFRFASQAPATAAASAAAVMRRR